MNSWNLNNRRKKMKLNRKTLTIQETPTPTQVNLSAFGSLQIQAVRSDNRFPIQNATVSLSIPDTPDQIVEQTTTDASGQTDALRLSAPPLEYSLTPGSPQPYANYNIRITASGFKSVTIHGCEVLPDAFAIQPVQMEPEDDPAPSENPVVIPDHTLYGTYPPKIAETEIQPINESGEIVLSRVVVPQTIVVHDGAPTDSSARDYYVPYRDYIKNVASSEIYATWPQASITANVLAIMSFTLNRVYTEHYRNRGYDFTITSSTAFDHKWIYGRNIYESISVIVDEIFDNYLSRPGVKQPILTQYCDGRQVQCLQRGWMTQWGSLQPDPDFAPFLWRQHLYQYRRRDLWNPRFLAWIRSDDRIVRSKSSTASGTARRDRNRILRDSAREHRRYLWSGNGGIRLPLPVNLRSPTDRCRRFCNLV